MVEGKEASAPRDIGTLFVAGLLFRVVV